MLSNCGCASDYNALIAAMDELIMGAQDLKPDPALLNFDIAMDLMPSAGKSCGIHVDRINNAMTALREPLEKFRRTKGAEDAAEVVKKGYDALRVTERLMQECEDPVCGCARAMIAFSTVYRGATDAIGRASVQLDKEALEDVGMLSDLSVPAIASVASACRVPSPDDVIRTIVEYSAAIKDLVEGPMPVPAAGTQRIRRGIPFTPQLFPVEEEERGRPPLSETERAMKAISRELRAETPEERETRRRNVARLQAMAARLGPVATLRAKAKPEVRVIEAGERLPWQLPEIMLSSEAGGAPSSYSQDVPAGFEEIMKEAGIVIEEPKKRITVEIIIPTPEYLKKQEEEMRKRGYVKVVTPGPIVSRPPEKLFKRPELGVQVEIIRGRPTVKWVRPRGMAIEEASKKLFNEYKGTLLDALVDADVYLHASVAACGAQERVEEAMKGPLFRQEGV